MTPLRAVSHQKRPLRIEVDFRTAEYDVRDEISPDNFATYAEAGIPLAYVFVPSTDPKRAEIVKALEPVAREHKGKVNFVWIDAVKVRCPGRLPSSLPCC